MSVHLMIAVRGEPAADPLGRFIAIRAADAHVLVPGAVGSAGAGAAVRGVRVREALDDGRQFGLQRVDGLLDDGVRFQVTRAFDVEVERCGLGVVVVWLVGRSGGFPFAVFRDGPSSR